jgi:hypothetical protein
MHHQLGSELLRLPVRVRSIEVGRPRDLVLDIERMRAVGLELRCRDGVIRFLPLAAAELRPDEVAVKSALALVEEHSFYRARAATLRELRGAPVERGTATLGTLVDVVLAADGVIAELVVEPGDDGGRRVVAVEGVHVAARQALTAD